jgi:hypothetical protein
MTFTTVLIAQVSIKAAVKSVSSLELKTSQKGLGDCSPGFGETQIYKTRGNDLRKTTSILLLHNLYEPICISTSFPSHMESASAQYIFIIHRKLSIIRSMMFSYLLIYTH